MTHNERFKQALLSLTDQCRQGQIHYKTWDEMRKAVEKHPKATRRFEGFFNLTARAHLYHSISFANRIFDTSSGAASIYYLLNCARSHPNIFNGKSSSTVNNAVDEDCDRLEEHSDELDALIKWRNKEFSHIEKPGKRAVLLDWPVKYVEIEALLQLADDILHRYASWLDLELSRTAPIVNVLTSEVPDLFSFLEQEL